MREFVGAVIKPPLFWHILAYKGIRKEHNKMACSLYNNNGYGCGGCVHFVKTNSVTLTDNVLILNIPQATYSNKEKVCICIAQAIPEVTSADTVAVTIGTGTTQYVLRTKCGTKCGNNVHADQLRSRKVYHTNVATDVGTFMVSSCELNGTAFNFPTI